MEPVDHGNQVAMPKGVGGDSTVSNESYYNPLDAEETNVADESNLRSEEGSKEEYTTTGERGNETPNRNDG